MERLLTISEVSEITRLSKPTIYAWVAERKIPHIKLGARVLFDKKLLDEWIKSFSVEEVIE